MSRIQTRLPIAWKTIAAVDMTIAAYGIMALLNPSMLTAGFETSTDETWLELATRDEQTAEFILVGFRLLGALNLTVGLLLVAIAAMSFRHGRKWAWWTLLVGNTLAIGAPVIYDRVVGYVGVLEVLEYVALLAVYVALAATRQTVLRPLGS